MRVYSISGGDAAKLLAATLTHDPVPVTDAVATIRDPEAAAGIARHLTLLSARLPFLAGNTVLHPKLVGVLAEAFGVDPATLIDGDGGLRLSVLADVAAPDGGCPAPSELGDAPAALYRLLGAVTQLPVAAQRAVRAELRSELAVFDGPPVVAEIGEVDGVSMLSVVDYLAAGPADDVAGLLDEEGTGVLVAAERIVDWYSTLPGHPLYGMVNELIAAEWEVQVLVDVEAAAAWIGRHRPGLR